MTDNEIIKALEACKEKNHLVCNVCPLGRSGDCVERLAHNAFWLINRQKEEIEGLKEPLKKLSKIGYCHNFQLERSDLVSWIYAVCDVIKVAKEMTEVQK